MRHPASASCLGRHSRLAGRCPNNCSLFPPLAAVAVVALRGGWSPEVGRGESEHPSLPLAQRSVFARLRQAETFPAKRHTFLVLFWCQKRTSLGVRPQYQKAPRTSGGNAGRFGYTGCMPYASGWGCAAEDWAAMNSAASSGMSSKSSSLPISTLSGGFLNRISYRIGTIYRVIRVA